MYLSNQKEAFWTAFGKYMRPVLSSEGVPVTWINYKTGVSGLHFRMDADDKRVFIAIVISSSDPSRQQELYDQFVQMKQLLEEALGENDWVWQSSGTISKELSGVSVYRQDDWPAIISFLKPRIMALDEFWSTAKYVFSL